MMFVQWMIHLSQGHTVLYAALMLGLIFVSTLRLISPPRRQTVYTTKNRAECAQIISGSTFKGYANILSQYEARAQANQRLPPAFGVDNAFTTDQIERYRNYRNEIGTMLRPDWNVVADTAKGLAKRQRPRNLVILVQSFVLKMILNVLFRCDVATLDDTSILLVASEINTIWINSKKPCRILPWEKQERLHEALRLLIPSRDPLDPQTNAMNIILPAFETMWRVVLRCFIEVRFRSAKETEEWIAALRVFLENPTLKPGDARKEELEVAKSVSIVREALRLYPPTRHIYRQFRFANGSSVLAMADIEGLHRDTEIWSSDANCFRPSRWKGGNYETEQKDSWMPFGSSPFLCPAKPKFGPRMIAILVAALVDAYSDGRYRLTTENTSGHMDLVEFDGPLRSERDSYESLLLEEVALHRG